MRQLTVLAPDLAQLRDQALANLTEDSLQYLSFFCALSKKNVSDTSFIKSLFQSFGLKENSNFSVAALTALVDKIDVYDAYCLRIDPVELRADLAAVYMYGNDHFTLTSQQQKKIHGLIQPLLNEYGMRLISSTNKRWYLVIPSKPQINTYAPEALIGKDILNFLPQGKSPINWQVLQTEIQMVLHGHVDLEPINSLWIWGEGEKLDKEVSVEKKIIFTENVLTRGLAQYTQQKLYDLKDFSLNNLSNEPNLNVVLVYDKFSKVHDYENYLESLKYFDKTLMKVMIEALKQKVFNEIILLPNNGFQYKLTRGRFYTRFWKRKKLTLKELCKKLLSDEKNSVN